MSIWNSTSKLEMNNAGSALLNGSNNAAVSAVSAVNSVTSSFGNYGSWFLVIGIVLLLILSYLLYQQQVSLVDILPGTEKTPRDWREIERQAARGENSGFGENWCFVGEDVTGRWCVKVPQPDACSPERLFSSRPGCELVPASPLPLGLVAKGGAAMNPLIAATHSA
jgi:hypothetical protein